MLIRSKKKVLGVPLDNSATSYHRVIQPLYKLAEAGHPVQFLADQEKQIEQYEWADILYIQCLYAPDAYQFYASWKDKGKKIILDFDDDYINIPSDSPEQTEVIDKNTGESYSYPSFMRSLYVQMFIQLADIVVVTTSTLEKLYKPWAKKIKIIPNCVSDEMRRDYSKKPNDKVRILWSGSASHLPDLEIIKEPLIKLLDKFGDKIEMHFQGPLDFSSVFPNLPIVGHGAVNFAEYLNKVQEINPDIALGPLKDNPFNAAKSNLKYCQMTLMESAFVGSKYGPYKECIDHKVDGMLAANDKEWINSISLLVERPEFRSEIVKNALHNVEINYMLDKHLPRWEQLLVG
jgi:hypothetical protein